jgi:hypothetical protein
MADHASGPAVPPPGDPVDLGLASAAAVWLPRLALLETLTVVVLIANRVTTQVEGVASAVGPLHGMLYLATIACAWIAQPGRRSRWLAWIPVVGGLLAVRAGRHDRSLEETSLADSDQRLRRTDRER